MESSRGESPVASAARTSRGKSRPGAVSSQKMNFRSDERAFPVEDVPVKALEAKKEVLSYLQTDVLGISKPRWNGSVSTGQHFPDPNFKRELHQFSSINPEHNYRAEVVLKEPPRPLPKGNKFKFDQRVFMEADTRDQVLSKHLSTRPSSIPNHPDLVNARPWDYSTSAPSTKERLTKLNDETQKSLKNSTRMMQTLQTYTTPTEQISHMIDEQRARKKEEAEIHNRIQTLYGREILEAEKSKAVGTDKYQLEEIKRLRQEVSKQMESTRGPPRKTKIYAHTGAWQLNPQDNTHAWSCCMSSVEDSKGCTLSRVINLDSWNTESF